MKKKQNQKASAAEQARAREIEALDLVTVEFEGKEVTVGKERHRFCEPIFDPAVVAGLGLERFTGDQAGVGRGEEGLPVMSLTEEGDDGRKVGALQDAVGRAVAQADSDIRQYLWQGLFVTGHITRFVKGQSYLLSVVLGTDIWHCSYRHLVAVKIVAIYRKFRAGY